VRGGRLPPVPALLLLPPIPASYTIRDLTRHATLDVGAEMPSNSLDNTARPGPTPLACTERSERACTEQSERACTACPACPERMRGKPSRREHSECVSSPSTEFHSPLLFANRGNAELEMVPSRCKQRTTTLSNRGEMRVVEALRREPRTPNSLPCLFANRNIAELAIVLSHCKQRATSLSNRYKLPFFGMRENGNQA
jgi:hypothetical protein